MDPRAILLGGLTALLLRGLSAFILSTTQVELASLPYMALHIPLTSLGHVAGGFVAGSIAAGHERRNAVASVIVILAACVTGFILLPQLRTAILGSSGVSIETYIVSAILEAGAGLLLGGHIAKAVADYRRWRIVGSAPFNSGRSVLNSGSILARGYGLLLVAASLVILVPRMTYNLDLQEPVLLADIRDAGLLLSAALGGWVLKVGNRLARASAHGVDTGNACTLVLRSFRDDQLSLETRWSLPLPAPLGRVLGAYFNENLFDLVAECLGPLGKVTAVGSPLEVLPPDFEGLRQYFEASTEDWKTYVQGQMASCAIIVLMPASTEGLRWEMQQVASRGYKNKTVLLFPPRESSEEKLQRWQAFATPLREHGIQAESPKIDGTTLALVLGEERPSEFATMSGAYEDVSEQLRLLVSELQGRAETWRAQNGAAHTDVDETTRG